MTREHRFGDFVKEMTIRQRQMKYDNLTPEIEYDELGEPIPYQASKIPLTAYDVISILEHYLGVRILEQVKAVLPLAAYLIIFQLIILRKEVTDFGVIGLGLVSAIIGLMMFMEGLKVGLMPFGETIGQRLPKRSALWVVMSIAFLLGIGVTLAEPAIGALKLAGSTVEVTKAPYLYALLNDYSQILVSFVGIGVGAAVVLGTLRFLYGWSLKPYIYIALSTAFTITTLLFFHPELKKVIGLAWDCGAVTTGPITVPLVLSLGIGISRSAGKNKHSLSGFGIVTLASLFPIISVMILALLMSFTISPETIIANAHHLNSTAVETPWYQESPIVELIASVRAIIPLVVFLLFVLWVILRDKLSNPSTIAYGIVLSLIGMMMFNVGLTYGLTKLGNQSGGIIPSAFMAIETIENSPLYFYMLGLIIALVFSFFLGFGATLAEPALNALGLTVESLSSGVFKKRTLMVAVATGVAIGIALGITKICFEISLFYFLVPGYLFAGILTYFSSEEYVNVAWDCAGVTTGPVTVPLVLAMGLGFSDAVNVVEGFGVLSLASIGPIICVLIVGKVIELKQRKGETLG